MISRCNGIVFAPDADGTGDGGGGGAEGEENEDEDDGEDPGDDVEALKAENAKLKAQADKARTKAAREAKAKADAERKKNAESEDTAEIRKALADAEKRAVEAETKSNQALARSIAAEKGARNAAVVVKLLDFDDMVDPTDEKEVGEAIDALIKENPYLKARKTKTDGGEGGEGNTSTSTDLNAALRRATGRQ